MRPKDSTKYFWYAIAIGVISLFILILLSSVLSVGERLNRVHVYLEYGFYGVAFLLVYFLIFRPVHIIFFSPSFSVETTLDRTSRRNYLTYKRVAKRLIERDDISDEEKEKLKESLPDPDRLRESLNHVFTHAIKKSMNRTIKRHAKTVMISTAISQNGRLDFFTVIVVNLKMIKELVVMCGFRPSFKHLARLTINVFTTALIAEGLEDMDMSEVLPQSTLNTIGDLPLVRPLVSSVTQGVSNALLTLRIGIVTRKFLFSDAQEITKEQIRKTALLEAAKLTPVVLSDALSMFPRRMFKFFRKKDVDDRI
ncbi:MAG: DUF697 domain-containing protein [Acholeplasmataceae bacterium]